MSMRTEFPIVLTSSLSDEQVRRKSLKMADPPGNLIPERPLASPSLVFVREGDCKVTTVESLPGKQFRPLAKFPLPDGTQSWHAYRHADVTSLTWECRDESGTVCEKLTAKRKSDRTGWILTFESNGSISSLVRNSDRDLLVEFMSVVIDPDTLEVVGDAATLRQMIHHINYPMMVVGYIEETITARLEARDSG